MKLIFSSVAIILSLLFGANAFADTVTKITISGEPVTVTKSGNVYVFPGTTTYTTTSDYYYISVDGVKKVCYRDVKTTFAGLDPTDLSLKIGEDTLAVHCYTYSPDFFTTK